MRFLLVSFLAPRPRNPALGLMVHHKARALSRAGHDVELLAPARIFPDTRLLGSLLPPRSWSTISSNAAEWLSMWREARGVRKFEGVRYRYRQFATLPVTSRLGQNAEVFARRQQPWLEATYSRSNRDFVLGHFSESAPLVKHLADVIGCRSGLFVHEDLDGISKAIGEDSVRQRLACADVLFTHGILVREQIRDRVASTVPVEILPSPIDDAILGVDPVAKSPPSDAFQLLCVSRFFALKNQQLLLDTVALWNEERRAPRMRLELAGDRGPTRHRLEREIARRRLGESITIKTVTGARDIANAFSRSHALVHPSRRESLSMAVLEALAAGLPVLSGPDIGVRAEFTRLGWALPPCFDVDSVASLIEALEGLVRRYSDHRDRALRLSGQVRSRFTDSAYANELTSALRRARLAPPQSAGRDQV